MVAEFLIETFGPFVIPVAIFLVGLVGYGLFVFLSRRGHGSGESGRSGGND